MTKPKTAKKKEEKTKKAMKTMKSEKKTPSIKMKKVKNKLSLAQHSKSQLATRISYANKIVYHFLLSSNILNGQTINTAHSHWALLTASGADRYITAFLV